MSTVCRSKSKIVSSKATATLPLSTPHLLREKQVLLYVPISRAELWKRVKENRFPSPIKLSAKISAWRSQDIAALLQSFGVDCEAA